MADAGKNSMWSNLSSKSQDILGPDYSYADNIRPPSSLGVGSSGSFSQVGRNANGIFYYISSLISGDPPLGNQFYINTGGTCTAPDGQLRPRYNYVNNKSSGSNMVPASMQEIGSSFNGLIPGVVSDIGGLNPTYIFSALVADASPPCQCYKCDVSSGNQYQFLTPSLSADFNLQQCQQVDISNCPAIESFSNEHEDKAIPTILAGLVILYFVFSGK